jgi:iron complex outermembrane receptor protein
MNTQITPDSRSSSPTWLRRFAVGLLALVLPCVAFAQAGAITGRVYNPATREYIRNAEVRVEGTNLVTISEDGGYYRINNAPSGTVTVTATYTGHESASTTLNVAAGSTATHDFELAPTGARANANETITLAAFVVETEREGQAKAVSEQKNAMNVKQVMSADNFGDMSEQNVGEFLKYMPGITIDYVETDTRAARMGGMDSRYGYVTLDGNTQASGNSGSLGADSRQFEFESVSMNNIESIEVNKTLTADMWADAPAGTVNLRTRSALDLKRAKFGFSAGVIWNSLENGFERTPRHDDGLHAKTRPRFSFDYTNQFLDHKLGITLNGSFTNIYKEQYRNSYTYDYTSAQAIAAGTPLITAINFKDGPKITAKSAGGIKVDLQATPNLRMYTAISYAYFDDFFANRNLNFVTNSASLGAGSSLLKVVANNTNNTTTRLDQSGESTGKLKDNINLGYVANYKAGPWKADLNLLYSRARENRGGLAYGTIGNTPVRLGAVGFTAVRDAVDSTAWTFTQNSGANWYDLNSWGKQDQQALNSNIAWGATEEYSGRLDLTRSMSWDLPSTLKAGIGRHVTLRHRKITDSYNATWRGQTPVSATIAQTMPISMAYLDIDTGFGGGIGHLPVPDKEALYVLSKTHPEYFSRTEANLATDLGNVIGSFQGNQEDVKALYLMDNTRIGKWQVQGGLRLEDTDTQSTIMHDVPISQNPFATRTTTTTGGVTRTTFAAATTRDYVQYRWSKGKETQWGSYDDLLGSIAAKYNFSRNLNFKLGFNQAIKRPDLDKIAGPWTSTVDSGTGTTTITIPNPDLKPERSKRFSLMTEYYFEPSGTVSVHLFETRIKNAVDDVADGITAEEAGFGSDPDLQGVLFRTFHQLDEERRIRGIEISYSQQLTFLKSELLRGTSVFATYSQYSATPRPRDGKFYTRNATAGIGWNYRKVNFRVNGTWVDETFTGSNTVAATSRYTPNAPEYFRPRTILFVNAGYKLTKNLTLFVSGDRAYDSGKIWFYKYDGRIRQIENYGSQWSVGVSGNY